MNWKKIFEKFSYLILEGAIIVLAVWIVQYNIESKDNKITLAKTMAESNFKEVAYVTNKRLFATKMLIENYKDYHDKINDSLLKEEHLTDR